MCFLGVDLGAGGGGKETRSPPRRSVTASGTRHNSPRGGRILGIRASTSERQTLGPLFQPPLPPLRRPRGAPSSRSSSPPPLPSQVRKPARAGRPGLPATGALAGLRALSSCPSACPTPTLSPSSGKLTLELPGRAKAEGAGGPAASPGVPAPAPSGSPTGSSQTGRALSLCLPGSLDRSLRPGYLGGLQDGTAREGSLCAAPRE